ncbi:UDP-N-acetylglucosamine transferase subunit ALG13 [Lachnospiraceae bacterium]|nr:UDP-N-acetylglucosamine transferase subunit ALG13 [Lachnospiraceae bacterium]
MIFFTLGTQKFQMNRLVQAADDLAKKLDEEIFVQTGHSGYTPVNCDHTQFMNEADYNNRIKNCRILVTHAGVGTIISGLTAGKPVIVVPRLKKFNEHVDDHQLQIAEAFAKKKNVLSCPDVEELEKFIKKAETFSFEPYVVHGGKIEDIVQNFVDMF